MAEVSYDELMGFISIKVFCPEDPHRNLALRWLAGNIVYTNEQVGSRKRRYTKLFGPAGTSMHYNYPLLLDSLLHCMHAVWLSCFTAVLYSCALQLCSTAVLK
jgi:hypothetical protein